MSWQEVLAVLPIVVVIIGGWWAFEARVQKKLEKALAQQDALRKAELAPIQKQVDNHIPTQIGELRTDIREIRTDIREIRTDIKELRDLIMKYIDKE